MTVPLFTTLPLAATVPLSTLVTKRSAWLPSSSAVISHGPLIGEPANVSATSPVLSTTIKQPALTVAEVPSVVGTLPTITQPLCSTASAVVRPTPPGQAPGRSFALMWAKTLNEPLGEIWTMVVPVPCRFLLLLKLLTRTSPWTSFPTEFGTTTVPYGLTSPFL